MSKYCSSLSQKRLEEDFMSFDADGTHYGNNSDYYLEGWDYINPIANKFAESFKTYLRISNPHGISAKPNKQEKDKLYVFFYSCPQTENNPTKKTFTKVFGIDLSADQGMGFEPSTLGLNIMDDDQVVAQYLEGTLYILFDLPHERSIKTKLIWRRILEEFATQVLIGTASKDQKNVLAKKFGQFKYFDFKTALEKQNKRNTDRLQSVINELNRDIDHFTAEIVSKSRELNGLVETQNKAKQLSVDFNPIMEKIQKINGIEKVEYDEVGGKPILIFYTRPIEITHEGKTYLMGKYYIEVYFDGDNGGVRIHNLSKKIRGQFDHPHIEMGRCCLGNIKSVIPQLIAEYKFDDLILYLIAFLESYNVHGAYKYIENWPVKEEVKA